MLINQNHELSIRLKRKNENIMNLNNLLKQEEEIEEKVSPQISSQYPNEEDDDSFSSGLK